MKYFLCTFLAFCLPAYAKVDLNEFRRMIDAKDFAALERSIGERHENALKTGNSIDLWKIYGTLFQTTHPQRRAAIQEWTNAYPTSAYAHSAAAWMYVKSGWLYRGERIVSETSPEAMRAFQFNMNKANEHTLTAYEQLPTFIPASDAVFLMQQIGQQRRNPEPVLDVVLDSIPNSRSVAKAVSVMAPEWGGSRRKQERLCNIYAVEVSGYNAEICKVSLFFAKYGIYYFTINASKREIAQIKTVLEKYADAPELEYWRYVFSLATDRSFENLRRLQKLHFDENYGIHDHEYYAGNGMRYARIDRDPQVIVQSYLNLKDYADQILKDDPLNYEWLEIAILHELEFRHLDHYTGISVSETILTDGQLKQLRRMWYDAMVYGRFDSDMWILGGQLATVRTDFHDVKSKQIFTQNRLYYSGHNLDTTLEYLAQINLIHKQLSNPELTYDKLSSSREDAIETAECDIVRAVRIVEKRCSEMSYANCIGTNNHGRTFEQGQQISRKSTQCLTEHRMPLDAILYEPVPFDQIDFQAMGWP
ncbi:DUF4034 domain-containing protein [Parasulfitobacter algicola]|uniref:DUF4034 domain-containing protein n=1 Tax=Parasulfitobacter algicola TaxID=2614809 RepID=A0ABX2ISQ7_9RHOB|nr:DUF4034 domain-containing protein [Sulfitobacter algicola]NSX55355.1 DUF4034 domain-containing protein [Sulfitobacter algicola]